MRTRASADLSQLSDDDFFVEIANGMHKVLNNASTLADDARHLFEEKRSRSASLLLAVASEEAAKYHILLDAVRCERNTTAMIRQLKRFNDHLAKGLYARYVSIAPASFEEVLNFLRRERETLFLDGPNDVDWIFRNRVLQDREEVFYVDYVEAAGEHLWLEPSPLLTIGTRFPESRPLVLATRFSRAGFDNPAALRVIAEIWRGVDFAPEDHWQKCHERNIRTLTELDERSLLSRVSAQERVSLAWDWLFPLHSADLAPIKIERHDLEQQQRDWYPGD